MSFLFRFLRKKFCPYHLTWAEDLENTESVSKLSHCFYKASKNLHMLHTDSLPGTNVSTNLGPFSFPMNFQTVQKEKLFDIGPFSS